MHYTDLPDEVLSVLRRGGAIPAHPLALTEQRQLDVPHQKALSRYYLDAGATGVAVGVHTTQFEIRDVGLFEPVLKLAAETVDSWLPQSLGGQKVAVKVSGLVGKTAQAVAEAQLARGLGYHAGLLSLAAWKGASEDELIGHCQAVAAEIPLIGFYLQPAVGGILLSPGFWQRFAAIENVVAIKMAPFNRYRTLDVIRGVVAAGAEDRVTLYTGNDDHIVLDLLSPFLIKRDGEDVRIRIKGGLLGHWSVWVKPAVELLDRIHQAIETDNVDFDLLALDSRVTDCNSAFFDVANDFAGVIAGCHEVLRRQGLLQGIWCLNKDEQLSPGQIDEINRVYAEHGDLADDDFVTQNLERWLS